MIPDTEAALKWMVGVLDSLGVPFQISGGFGAHLWGATRPINDIDIDVSDGDVYRVTEQVSPFLIYGPARYRDTTWDLLVATLIYRGQEIDIAGGTSALVCNKFTGLYEPLPFHLDRVVLRPYRNLILPVQAREDLINYKSKILYDEEKHLHDVAAMRAT